MTRPRTLGVVGTLVWDRIVDRSGGVAPVEDWGGIAYSLMALASSLPEGWSVVPILKIGADMAEEGRRFLRGIPHVDDSAVVVVAEANNRMELRYQSDSTRRERLSGGVPRWRWDELAPRVGGCDAVYLNFISGYEMDLETAARFRGAYSGPAYADLHSLFLGTDAAGQRMPQALDSWPDWFRCFDAVQMNEDEFGLLSGAKDSWESAEQAVRDGLVLCTVTRAERGASYVTRTGVEQNPMSWRSRGARGTPARAVRGHVKLTGPAIVGDPTGCGDVWGATMFARLLVGDRMEDAARGANRLAALNVGHCGVHGLCGHFAESNMQTENAS